MAADEYDGPYTNSVTGKQIATADHFKIVRDVAIGESTWVGLTMHIQVPGKGVVAMAAGKLVVWSRWQRAN
ncbi:MAG: hypothetical protein HY782_09165 [Chloroflexi bacterium]|nr:hypothetical protein [Chloroflexota bacterium]